MEHAKKLVLLSRESFDTLQSSPSVDRLQITPVSTVQTKGSVLSRLDNEMNEILNSSEMDERDKCRLYQQALQKYLNYQKVENTPKLEKITPETVETKTKGMATDKILETVPKSYQQNAEKLLNHLVSAGSVTWDEKGSLKIDGVDTRGNIIDLLNNCLRKRKGSPPIGQRQFITALRRASIPREFIGNQIVRHQVTAETSTSSDEELKTAHEHSSPDISHTPKRKTPKSSRPQSLKWRRM